MSTKDLTKGLELKIPHGANRNVISIERGESGVNSLTEKVHISSSEIRPVEKILHLESHGTQVLRVRIFRCSSANFPLSFNEISICEAKDCTMELQVAM